METIEITLQTHFPKQLLDITDTIQDILSGKKVENHLVSLFVLHTTAAITTADLDPGTDLDFLDAVTRMIPSIQFCHPHNPAHAPDHILASLLGPSLTIPVKDGELLLGMWQRIVLVEFDGPRSRSLVVSIH